jgi:cell division protein FtsN
VKNTRATHRQNDGNDGEYTEVVIGMSHVLLFSLIVGVLIFGSGYLVGFQSAQSDLQSTLPASAREKPAATSANQSTPQAPVVIPEVVVDPLVPTDVVEDLERLSTASLTAGRPDERDSGPGPDAVTATAPVSSPEASSITRPSRPQPRPTAGGEAIYLEVSTLGAKQDAERLANNLAAEGFRAVVDGALVANKHTVLVGPFRDLDFAATQAKELREHNVEAFPVRR